MSGLRDRMNRLRGGSVERDVEEVELAKNTEMGSPSVSSESIEVPTVPEQLVTELEETEWISPVWASFGVKLQATEIGSFLLRKIIYPVSFRHGLHAIDELHHAAPGLTNFHPTLSTSAEQILFLDLETTGLGVGTGNVPFMVGIGYMQGEHFVIEQALIRHPAEERAMLTYLQQKLSNYTFLATYNGRHLIGRLYKVDS